MVLADCIALISLLWGKKAINSWADWFRTTCDPTGGCIVAGAWTCFRESREILVKSTFSYTIVSTLIEICGTSSRSLLLFSPLKRWLWPMTWRETPHSRNGYLGIVHRIQPFWPNSRKPV